MVLFDFLLFATEILICYQEEAELPNNPKVVRLNIIWSRAIDGHWHAIFLVLSNSIQPGVERLFSVHAR